MRWIAAVGSGFTESSLRAFHQTLTQIERGSSPFSNEVLLAGGRPVWVEPAIVVNVEYKEWTHDDHLRAPDYQGVELAGDDHLGPGGRVMGNTEPGHCPFCRSTGRSHTSGP